MNPPIPTAPCINCGRMTSSFQYVKGNACSIACMGNDAALAGIQATNGMVLLGYITVGENNGLFSKTKPFDFIHEWQPVYGQPFRKVIGKH